MLRDKRHVLDDWLHRSENWQFCDRSHFLEVSKEGPICVSSTRSGGPNLRYGSLIRSQRTSSECFDEDMTQLKPFSLHQLGLHADRRDLCDYWLVRPRITPRSGHPYVALRLPPSYKHENSVLYCLSIVQFVITSITGRHYHSFGSEHYCFNLPKGSFISYKLIGN